MSELGRRLPKGARFAQVTELFDMAAEDVEHTMIWLGGEHSWSSGWMQLASLLRRPYPSHEAHLSSCPSSMVVVVRDERVQS